MRVIKCRDVYRLETEFELGQLLCAKRLNICTTVSTLMRILSFKRKFQIQYFNINQSKTKIFFGEWMGERMGPNYRKVSLYEK